MKPACDHSSTTKPNCSVAGSICSVPIRETAARAIINLQRWESTMSRSIQPTLDRLEKRLLEAYDDLCDSLSILGSRTTTTAIAGCRLLPAAQLASCTPWGPPTKHNLLKFVASVVCWLWKTSLPLTDTRTALAISSAPGIPIMQRPQVHA
jgi:hypothetical protein